MIEQRAQTLFQQGKLKSDLCHSIGRDASAVAFTIDLRPEDALCLWNGDLVPAFVKGAALEDWFRAFAATRNIDHQKESPSQHDGFRRLNIVSSSTAPEQIGAIRELALAARHNDSRTVIVVFPAPRPQLRSRWEAAMKLAGSRALPVVFVVRGVWNPDEGPGEQEALRNGIPAISVDGGDAVAAYRVACEAISRARQRRGPTLVKCVADSETRAASPEADRIHLQTEGQVTPDPGLAMSAYLKRKGLWNEEGFRQTVADIERELDLATRFLDEKSKP